METEENKPWKKYVVHISQPHDVYVGRKPKKGRNWGNPFELYKDGDRDEVVRKHREFIASRPDLQELARKELKGKILGCFCGKKVKCHADTLAMYANGFIDNENPIAKEELESSTV